MPASHPGMLLPEAFHAAISVVNEPLGAIHPLHLERVGAELDLLCGVAVERRDRVTLAPRLAPPVTAALAVTVPIEVQADLPGQVVRVLRVDGLDDHEVRDPLLGIEVEASTRIVLAELEERHVHPPIKSAHPSAPAPAYGSNVGACQPGCSQLAAEVNRDHQAVFVDHHVLVVQVDQVVVILQVSHEVAIEPVVRSAIPGEEFAADQLDRDDRLTAADLILAELRKTAALKGILTPGRFEVFDLYLALTFPSAGAVVHFVGHPLGRQPYRAERASTDELPPHRGLLVFDHGGDAVLGSRTPHPVKDGEGVVVVADAVHLSSFPLMRSA